ncbi:MAG: FimB/Mfa2 family fimbrial subunit [Alistipes sp.]|jgi:hypothetical protein|nr:FimB/Mfa2 family fimbrial subunit [Alistipes sp.]
MENCPTLRFNLSYTHNTAGVDRLADVVGDVRIYAFDTETGVLAGVTDASRADIARGYVEVQNPEAGVFTYVAWGVGGEDMTAGDFMELQMSDNATHTYTRAASVGETTLDDLYVMIDHDTLPVEIQGDVAPKRADFDDLFHDYAVGVEVSGDEEQTVDFDFIRNSNILDVSVTGIEHLAGRAQNDQPEQPLRIWVTGNNGRYRTDNTIDTHARTVRYESPYSRLDETSMRVDVKTLRLDIERHTDDPVRLYVADPDSGEILVNMNVLEAIGQIRDENGDRLYGTQEKIDREYEFPINIVLSKDEESGELSVRIFIREWEIVTPDAEFEVN